jgi:hypothetical protein
MEEKKLRHLQRAQVAGAEALAEKARRGDDDDARMTDVSHPQLFCRRQPPMPTARKNSVANVFVMIP